MVAGGTSNWDGVISGLPKEDGAQDLLLFDARCMVSAVGGEDS